MQEKSKDDLRISIVFLGQASTNIEAREVNKLDRLTRTERSSASLVVKNKHGFTLPPATTAVPADKISPALGHASSAQ